MNNRLYSSILFVFLLCISFVSAALVTEPASGVQTEFRDNSNQILDRQIEGGFATFTNKLFKSSEALIVNKAIVFYALLVMVLFMLWNVAPLVPFFGGVKGFLLSIIVTLLIAISGAYAIVADYLFFIAQSLTDAWSNLAFLGITILLAIILTFFSTILKKMYATQNVSQAEMSGMKLASDAAIAKKEAKINEEI